MDRKSDLLPIEYFQMVFTIPDTLNPLTLRNQKEIYSILFKSVSETLIELGKDLKYLVRYTHRVAISNNRITDIKDGKVTFRYRDYKDGNKNKLMTIEAHEFIRRFLLHILPDKFVKIRHYGILSNRNRRTKLKRCKEILGISTKEIKKKKS